MGMEPNDGDRLVGLIAIAAGVAAAATGYVLTGVCTDFIFNQCFDYAYTPIGVSLVATGVVAIGVGLAAFRGRRAVSKPQEYCIVCGRAVTWDLERNQRRCEGCGVAYPGLTKLSLSLHKDSS